MEHSEHHTSDPASEAPSGSSAEGDAPAQDGGEKVTIESLQAALAEARAEAERERENALRVRAEMENAHRRQERELEKSRRFALERIMGDLLPVLDGLEAALGSEQASLQQMREGSELTLRMMAKLVADHGVKEINPLHEAFNPELHQAMSMQPSSEHAPNTVVQVFQKGYQLHERLLRPALVVVASAAD